MFLRLFFRCGPALFAVAFLAGCGPQAPSGGAVRIRVDLGMMGREFQPRLRGVMIGSWESQATDGFLAWRLREAGVGFLEFPGGLEADGYDWQNPGAGRMSPARFAALAEAAGVSTRMCIVDYRAGDPAKAAGWVREARERGWGITHWEVGDEEYGYWAAGASPQEYAERFRRYYWAMKEADPWARIGAPLPLEDPLWTRAVLGGIGPLLDWVALSYYPQDPGGEDDARLLAAPDELGLRIEEVRGWLAEAAPVTGRGGYGEGLVVDGVVRGSQADRIGLRPGDSLIKLNDRVVRNLKEFRREFARLRFRSNVTIQILRGRYLYYVTLELGGFPS